MKLGRTSSRSSRSLVVVLALLSVFTLRPARQARAQACCAGGALLTPARLGPRERLGLGLQARMRGTLGTYASNGNWATIGDGNTESTWEQAAVASVRATSAWQASVSLPLVETHRRTTGLSETGAGLGDLTVTSRYDLWDEMTHAPWPSLALLAGFTAPTGRAPDAATKPLATDTTGAGTWDLSAGLGAERSFDRWFVSLSGWITHHVARDVRLPDGGHVRESFAPRLSALALGGYLFANDMAAALYLNVFHEGNKTREGHDEPGTAMRLTTLGATWVWPWAERARLQVALFGDLPLANLGRNHSAALGGSLTLLWVWFAG